MLIRKRCTGHCGSNNEYVVIQSELETSSAKVQEVQKELLDAVHHSIGGIKYRADCTSGVASSFAFQANSRPGSSIDRHEQVSVSCVNRLVVPAAPVLYSTVHDDDISPPFSSPPYRHSSTAAKSALTISRPTASRTSSSNF